MSIEIIITIIINAVSLGGFGGMVIWRIKTLEKKQDKHNHIVARSIRNEESAKALNLRVDKIEKEGKNEHTKISETLTELSTGQTKTAVLVESIFKMLDRRKG